MMSGGRRTGALHYTRLSLKCGHACCPLASHKHTLHPAPLPAPFCGLIYAERLGEKPVFRCSTATTSRRGQGSFWVVQQRIIQAFDSVPRW